MTNYILLVLGCIMVSLSQYTVLFDLNGSLLVVGIITMIWGVIWDLIE